MTRPYLWALAIIFTAFGIGYLFAPEPFARAADLTPGPGGLTDIRATYGGFQIGFGLYLAWSALSPARYKGALLAAALVAGAVGCARLFGLLVDAAPSTFHYIGLAFEIPLTICSILLYRRLCAAAGC